MVLYSKQSILLKYGVLALFGLILVSLGSSTVLVNSQSWEDVYSGASYANDNGEEVFFTKTEDAQDVLNILPKTEPVTIIQSSDQPYVGNLDTVLETRGFEVEEVIEVEDSPTQLYSSDENKFVVIERGSPSASIVAASLANNKEAWPLIVHEGNIDEAESLLQDADEVVMVGLFSREIDDVVSQYADERFVNPNKFAMSKEVAERVMELNSETKSAYIADGTVIESDLISSNDPILLSGTNFPPQELEDFIMENSRISSTVIIGERLTTVGEELKDNLESKNKELSIFVKYGIARGDEEQVRSLNTFSLPTGDIDLNIESADYDPSTNKLYVTYTNIGSSSLFMVSTLTVENGNGEDIASAGDDNTTFIGADRSVTKSYDIDVSASEAENSQVRFTTSYGQQEENLDTYVTPEEQGIFGPPYTLPISVEEINDNSQVEINELVYVPNVDRFKLKLENTGDVDAHASASLLDVIVSGREETFTSREPVNIPEGETKTLYIPAELDRIDLQENELIQATINYGEQEGVLINNLNKEIKFETNGSIPVVGRFTESPTTAGLGLLMLIFAGGLFYFRNDLKQKIAKAGKSKQNSNEGYSFNE